LIYSDIFHIWFRSLIASGFRALDLTKAHAHNRAMVVAQGAHTAELEADNAKLRSELEQAHQASAEADAARSSLCASRDELERECVRLCTGVDALKQEKAKIMTDREADVALEQKKFWDYRLSHRRKLHDLHVELDKAVNEIGVRCLPYPGKGSTIGEIIEWFNKEIQALPNSIAKANKNFLVYCLVGVL
jgi:seryl-tRNA synthetase